MKRIVPFLLCCALLAFACSAHALSGTEVAILRIGKADAIIITNAHHAILIDVGEPEDAEEILEYLQNKRVTSLDMMIITHFDRDHVGGAGDVLAEIPVGAVYDADYERDSNHYDRYVEAIAAVQVPRHRVTAEQVIELQGLTLTLLPTALDVENDNDLSLVVSMADPWHTFFFAGDAEEARIDELLEQGLAHHDMVKMPHHGRAKDNMATFLDALSPEIAVITDSDKNPADAETLALLGARGISTYETRDGDIRIFSSQSGLSVMQ